MSVIEFLKRLARHRADRRAARQSLGTLLAKPGDHLIRDIGLTRAEVERMLEIPEAEQNPPPARSLREAR